MRVRLLVRALCGQRKQSIIDNNKYDYGALYISHSNMYINYTTN